MPTTCRGRAAPKRAGVLLGAFVAGHAAMAQAADTGAPPSLTLGGRLVHPAHLSLADLQRAPVVRVAVDDPEHAPHHRVYAGALLWTLLEAAGPVDEPGGRTHLRHTLLATGRDGYAVALSIAEIDPAFEGKQVIVAYGEDGASLSGLRLVVPCDRKAGRAVRDLVEIDLR